MSIFKAADILLPKEQSLQQWSVIACDQFTAQPEYWERVRTYVADSPSTLNLVFPEAELSGNRQEKIQSINSSMRKYVAEDIFQEYKDSYIYVERTLRNGKIRKGIVGVVDLEEYDYAMDSVSNVRATEQTVVERIPPRVEIRRDASLELPHILLFCNDVKQILIEQVACQKEQLQQIYDFDLMENGGHISGWLVQGDVKAEFDRSFALYEKEAKEQGLIVLAVGDGNHSLATAKACYEELKAANPNTDYCEHPARYSLVELENIHDEAQEFEPIHRLLMNVDTDHLLAEMKQTICDTDGISVVCYKQNQQENIFLSKKLGSLGVGIIQHFLDDYLQKYGGEIDYIHGDDVLQELAKKENSIGFLVPTIDKTSLFSSIVTDGLLPRKTFSMGHAEEKRYYLEGRKIK